MTKNNLKNKYWIFHNDGGKTHTGFTKVDWKTWKTISKEPIVELFDTKEEWLMRQKELGVDIGDYENETELTPEESETWKQE